MLQGQAELKSQGRPGRLAAGVAPFQSWKCKRFSLYTLSDNCTRELMLTGPSAVTSPSQISDVDLGVLLLKQRAFDHTLKHK